MRLAPQFVNVKRLRNCRVGVLDKTNLDVMNSKWAGMTRIVMRPYTCSTLVPDKIIMIGEVHQNADKIPAIY